MSKAPEAAPLRAAAGQKRQDRKSCFEAAIPEPYQVLGLRLLPLSLGRYRLMRRFDVAFVADGEASAEMGDLILGVFICSQRCEDFLQLAASGQLERAIRAWSRKIVPHPWLCALPIIGKWWRARACFNFVAKMQLFESYIREASEVPKFYDLTGESAGGSATHWSHSMEVLLRSELGWSADEINEAPLSKAIADYFRHLESNGAVRIMTDEEIQAPTLTANLTPEQIKALQALRNN